MGRVVLSVCASLGIEDHPQAFISDDSEPVPTREGGAIEAGQLAGETNRA